MQNIKPKPPKQKENPFLSPNFSIFTTAILMKSQLFLQSLLFFSGVSPTETPTKTCPLGSPNPR